MLAATGPPLAPKEMCMASCTELFSEASNAVPDGTGTGPLEPSDLVLRITLSTERSALESLNLG